VEVLAILLNQVCARGHDVASRAHEPDVVGEHGALYSLVPIEDAAHDRVDGGPVPGCTSRW
jgi:hypothetical protein